MSGDHDDMSPEWRELGCKPYRKPRGSRAAWKLRAARRAPEDWKIEAAQHAYLGEHPYHYGDDAWRISIQVSNGASGNNERWTEVGHVVAESESEALESVAWLDALASPAPPAATGEEPDEPR